LCRATGGCCGHPVGRRFILVNRKPSQIREVLRSSSHPFLAFVRFDRRTLSLSLFLSSLSPPSLSLSSLSFSLSLSPLSLSSLSLSLFLSTCRRQVLIAPSPPPGIGIFAYVNYRQLRSTESSQDEPPGYDALWPRRLHALALPSHRRSPQSPIQLTASERSPIEHLERRPSVAPRVACARESDRPMSQSMFSHLDRPNRYPPRNSPAPSVIDG